MSITTKELDQWIKANWPKKFDRRTGFGNPTDLGVVGFSIFDLYQDIREGQVYTWTLFTEEYEDDQDFLGYVEGQDDLDSLYPIEQDKFFIVIRDFDVDPYKLRTGQIITANEQINSNVGWVGRVSIDRANAYWVEVGKGGGAEDILYTNTTPVPQALGGVQVGTTFEETPISTVLDMLLYPYQSPAFSSFSIAGIGNKEVGDVIPADTRRVTWGFSNPQNVQTRTIDLYDHTANTLIKEDLISSPHDVDFPEYRYNAPATQTFRITALNSNNSRFNRNTSVTWRWRQYFGESFLSTLDEAGVKGLRQSDLSNNVGGTYSMQAGGYKYFAWPTSFGIPNEFKDQSTNLDVAMQPPFQVTITNAFGISTDYNVFRTTNVLGGSITVVVR